MNDIQPKCFVIALKEHEHSRNLLNDCLLSANKFNWIVEPFWGYDGSKLTTEFDDLKLFISFDKMKKRPGIKGCFLSHWQLWHKCLELNESIIILEHDAIIEDNWKPIHSDSLIKLHDKKYKAHNNFITGNWANSTHAYYLTPNAATLLINFARNNGAFPSDVMIGDNVLKWDYLGVNLVSRNPNRGSSTTDDLEVGR